MGHENSCVSTGTATAYACNLDAALLQYNPRACYTIMANVANTGAATLALNGLAAIPIKKQADTALAANDIKANQLFTVCYDGTNMQMQSQTGTATAGASGVVLASDYGVVCNGSTDTTAAMQAAVTASKIGTQGLTLSMPKPTGACRITSTITISSVIGWELQGNSVEFHWDGASATTPMFLLQDVNHAHLHHFSVNASIGKPVATVFQFENGPAGTVTPSDNVISDVFVQCTNGGCTNGVRMAVGAGGDNNNDFTTLERVSFNNVANACVRLDHLQSKGHAFLDLGCANARLGNYIVEVIGGSFSCYRCRGGGSVLADYYIAESYEQNYIVNSHTENSTRLLLTGGPSTASVPVTIQDTRFGLTPGFIAPDNRIIWYKFRGPLTLQNLVVEAETANLPIEIYFAPGGNEGTLIALGNMIATTLATPFSSSILPTVQIGNMVNRNDGNGNVILPSTVSGYPPAAQVVTAGATLTANACGGLKLLTASSAVTTNTTNTFDAPQPWTSGCRMDVCNTASFAITLDANTNFRTTDGNDVVLAAASAPAIKCISVQQVGTQWVQVATLPSGSGTVSADQATRTAFYPGAGAIVGGSTGATFDTASRLSSKQRNTTSSASATLGLADGPGVRCVTTGGAVTLTLPAATSIQGEWLVVKTTTDTNPCSVQRGGTDTINFSTNPLTITRQAEYMRFDSDGVSNWYAAQALSSVTKRLIDFEIGTVGGSALTTASVVYQTIPSSCTLNSYTLMINAGTITVKFSRVAGGGTSLPTVGANSINTSGVGVSTGTVAQSNILTDFTLQNLTAGDILGMHVTAVATASYVKGTLVCETL